jgi:subtilisin family serine protease
MSQQIAQELRARGTAQVIVELKQPAAAGAPAAAAAAAAVSGIERHFTVSELSQDSALAFAAGRAEPPPVRYYPNLGLALGTVTRQGLAALRADTARVARVAGAPPLSLIRPTRVAAAPPPRQTTWGIVALGVPELWGDGLTGDGVLVGHLDTGVDGQHPALQGAIASFAEFDPLGFEVGPAPVAHDTDEHGTHTAATIAGRPVDGRAVGVAPGASLSSAVVIEGGNVIARVLAGMNRFAGQVDITRASVLSMSLGFRGWWDDFLLITDALRARNILPVFAVGNEGAGTSRSPGNYQQALSVGAMDRGLVVAYFSSSQRLARRLDPIVPDLIAPGVGVVSARPGGGWRAMDGSSMATPHVAGLAALLLQARPAATADQLEQAIFASCRRPAGMREQRGGRGLPNAPRALEELQRAAAA